MSRPVGSKNAKTEEWMLFRDECMRGGLMRFTQELMKLKGRDYVNAFLKLLEFHQPKLVRQELTGKDGTDLFPKPILDVQKNISHIQSNGDVEEDQGDSESEVVKLIEE